MTGKELYEQYTNSFKPAARFKNVVEYDLESFDDGMMARLESMRVEDKDSIICIFDFTEFEDFNKIFEQPVWYGKNNELLRWSESVYYPLDKKVNVWIPHGEITVFDLVDENVVYGDYKKSGSKASYVQWLEEQYMKMR